MSDGQIHIGTSAFTAAGWENAFYPPGMKPADYLTFYATRFNSLEVDSTFYRTPTVSTVKGWARKTPEGFVFAAKVPQVITHEKMLVDCDAEFNEFVETMDILGDKLGPLLFQFGYFNRTAFLGVNDFLSRLRPFLRKLPKHHKFAVEIRNKHWLVPHFVETLREHNVALTLIDQGWMPRGTEWFERFDPITADFTYLRLLGDRKEIEERTKVWSKVIVDRQAEMSEWANLFLPIVKRGVTVYVYANNHYAGLGPATAQAFEGLLGMKGSSEPPNPALAKERIKEPPKALTNERTLFE